MSERDFLENILAAIEEYKNLPIYRTFPEEVREWYGDLEKCCRSHLNEERKYCCGKEIVSLWVYQYLGEDLFKNPLTDELFEIIRRYEN